MRPQPNSRIDRYWARVLPLGANPDASGVIVGPHQGELTGYEGIYAVERHAFTVISAPPELVALIRSRLTDRHALMDARWWRNLFPNWVTLGPSVHSFLANASRLPATTAEPSTATQVVGGLQHRVTEEEWIEGGFSGTDLMRTWLLYDQAGHPVAASNLTSFDGSPADVGVITATEARGHGFGQSVASAAARFAITTAGIARWRALESNTPSRRLAAALGFTDDCRQLAARPPH